MKKFLTLLGSLACLHLGAQNVGVGTTNPTQQLDVNGNLRVRGLGTTAGQAPSFMQVDADGVLKLAKRDTVRANPTPVVAGNANTGNGASSDYPSAIAISGNKACVVNFTSRSLQLFDVSTSTPVLLGEATTNPFPQDVAVSGNKAYVVPFSDLSLLQVFDISGNVPVLLGISGLGYSWRILTKGARAYVTTQQNTLDVFDISTNSPVLIGTVSTGLAPTDFVLRDNRAYVVNRVSNSLQVFDISAATPVLLSTVTTDQQPTGIGIAAHQVFVSTRGSQSIQVFDLSGNQPALVSSTPVPFSPEKLRLNGNRAYMVGNNNLLNVYDASGRFRPVLVGNGPFVDASAVGKSLCVVDRKAYVGTSDKKLQVFELGFSGGITAMGADGSLVVVPDASLGGDNLGDHGVTQNLNLRGFQLVGNDGTAGISIATNGAVTLAGKLTANGHVYARDSIGIGTPTPRAPLQFANTLASRKVVLWEDATNDHQYYGLGVNVAALRYQSSADHAFYTAASPIASKPLLRLAADGRVGVGLDNPSSQLANTPYNMIGSNNVGLNTGSLNWQMTDAGYVQGLYNGSTASNAQGLAVKIAGTAAANRLLDLSTAAAPDAAGTPVMVVQGNGNVGLGTGTPQQKLDVQGNVAATGNITATGTISATGNISSAGNFVMGVQYVNTTTPMAAGTSGIFTCLCPTGTKVIGGGGGGGSDINQSNTQVNFTGPRVDGTGWYVLLTNTAGAVRMVTVWAVCAKVQ